jgi:hypothetical protein
MAKLTSIPLVGSTQNAKDALKFFFPRLAASVAKDGLVQAAFAANDVSSGIFYNADPEENPDIRYQYGETLARPVYGSIEFGNTDLQNQSGNEYTGIDGKKYTFSNILLPVAIISVTQPANIIKTKITGRNGNIKEYIGLDDMNITINSVITMLPDQAPTEFLNTLQKMRNAPVPIPVTNYFLNALGVNYIVIEDIQTPQEEGGYSYQAITITAVSDTPLFDFLP